MKKKSLIFSTFMIISSLLVGCNTDSENSSQSTNTANPDNTLKIYTTLYPLEDFTKKIGGDLVDVENVLPPGVDAHTYEPTTKMMVDIAKADAFIHSGVGIESFAEKVEESLKTEDVTFINAGEGIEYLEGEETAHEEEEHAEHDHEATHEESEHAEDEATHDHGDIDPHVWIDPIHSITLAENIKNELTELNPDGKQTFEENFQNLKTQLEELDQSFSDVVKNADKKEILVAHAAYGYWEKRYGIEQISVLGISPTEEPSQKELQTIIETAKEHDLTYIIFEANVSSNVADIVQAEIGAEALTLSNLESVTEENIKNNDDYISIMKKNLETLEKALSTK